MARGGKRSGAGRRKSPVKLAPRANKCVATAVLDRVGEIDKWIDLIEATAPKMVAMMGTRRNDGAVLPLSTKESASLLDVHFKSLRYLKDCRDGRPKQAIDVSGEVSFDLLAERLCQAKQRGNRGESRDQ